MRITELFTAQSIALDVAAPDQAAILDKLVDLQATHGNITDKDAYKKALYARGRMQASSVTAPRHIVASSASISAFVARPRLNAVALPQAVPRRRAAS